MNLGFLHGIVRVEEKLLLDEIRKRSNVEIVKLHDTEIIFDLHNIKKDVDIVLERCVSHSRALSALKILNDNEIPTVNRFEVADICGSKFLTTQAIIKSNIPAPKCFIAYTPESALKAIEGLGYPCILKPAVGSWRRLLSKVNDKESA